MKRTTGILLTVATLIATYGVAERFAVGKPVCVEPADLRRVWNQAKCDGFNDHAKLIDGAINVLEKQFGEDTANALRKVLTFPPCVAKEE